jgi:hypothetical protein
MNRATRDAHPDLANRGRDQNGAPGIVSRYFPCPLAPEGAGVVGGGAVGAGRMRTAVRGKVKVPPASSMTLIWQM